MDSDVWDMRYVKAVFLSLIITFFLVVIFLLFNFIYGYFIRKSFISVEFLLNYKLFYTDITILFTLICLYFIVKVKDDFSEI